MSAPIRWRQTISHNGNGDRPMHEEPQFTLTAEGIAALIEFEAAQREQAHSDTMEGHEHA